MKRTLWIAGIVTGVAAALWMGHENRRLARELARAKSIAMARPSLGTATQSQQHSSPPGTNSLPPSESNGATPKSASFASQWADPKWRAARFEEAYLGVETKYGRFFQQLVGWSPEKIESLKRQLANNDVSIMEAAMMQIGSDLDPKAKGEVVQAAYAKAQQQLGDYLGPTDYATFEQTMSVNAYRDSVGAIANAMRSNNMPVSADTEESILTAYADATKQAAQNAGSTDVGQLSPNDLAALKKQQLDAFHSMLLDKVSKVLDEKQLSIFMQAVVERDGGG